MVTEFNIPITYKPNTCVWYFLALCYLMTTSVGNLYKGRLTRKDSPEMIHYNPNIFVAALVYFFIYPSNTKKKIEYKNSQWLHILTVHKNAWFAHTRGRWSWSSSKLDYFWMISRSKDVRSLDIIGTADEKLFNLMEEE